MKLKLIFLALLIAATLTSCENTNADTASLTSELNNKSLADTAATSEKDVSAPDTAATSEKDVSAPDTAATNSSGKIININNKIDKEDEFTARYSYEEEDFPCAFSDVLPGVPQYPDSKYYYWGTVNFEHYLTDEELLQNCLEKIDYIKDNYEPVDLDLSEGLEHSDKFVYLTLIVLPDDRTVLLSPYTPKFKMMMTVPEVDGENRYKSYFYNPTNDEVKDLLKYLLTCYNEHREN